MRTLNEKLLNEMAHYIKTYQVEEHRSPSYRKIMHALGMSSLNLVQRYVFALEKRGRIRRSVNGNIDLPKRLDLGRSKVIPLVGDIACGEPNLANENIEASYIMPEELFGDGDLFLLRTFGDSMKDIGIEEGDLIVIRRQNTAYDGQIVVALVDGNATLKRLYHRNGRIVLHPENAKMQDIVVSECDIQGVLVSCIKMF